MYLPIIPSLFLEVLHTRATASDEGQSRDRSGSYLHARRRQLSTRCDPSSPSTVKVHRKSIVQAERSVGADLGVVHSGGGRFTAKVEAHLTQSPGLESASFAG